MSRAERSSVVGQVPTSPGFDVRVTRIETQSGKRLAEIRLVRRGDKDAPRKRQIWITVPEEALDDIVDALDRVFE